MPEYLHLGHTEVIPKNKYKKPNAYDLLHHAVLRLLAPQNKGGASSKSTSGQSLNDLLMIGRQVQPKLNPILQFYSF